MQRTEPLSFAISFLCAKPNEERIMQQKNKTAPVRNVFRTLSKSKKLMHSTLNFFKLIMLMMICRFCNDWLFVAFCRATHKSEIFQQSLNKKVNEKCYIVKWSNIELILFAFSRFLFLQKAPSQMFEAGKNVRE